MLARGNYWAVLIPVAILALAAPLALGRSSGTPAHTAATSVGVTGKEYRYILTRSSARHGTITFRFTNKGRVKHDFKIAGKKTPIIAPGRSATLKVRLRVGKYRYICTVAGHAAAGMKGTFRSR